MTIWGNSYRLEGKIPVPCETEQEYTQSFAMEKRRVAETEVGDVGVSTVFLVIDHSYNPDSTPVLFETMIFGKDGDSEYCERYCTWDEAVEGHKKACVEAFGYMPKPSEKKSVGNPSFIECIVSSMMEEEL